MNFFRNMRGAWRAMLGIVPAVVLIGVLSSSSVAAPMEGCPDFIEVCLCPAGCTQGHCERPCSALFGTDNNCHYRCKRCQCLAYAHQPGRGVLKLLQCLAPALGAAEPEVAAPKGRKEISNPDGDFVIMPRKEAQRLGGENAGIGIAIQQSSGVFVVSGVEDEGPAGKAGLKAGDELLQVDGKSTKGGSLQVVAEWIRGRPGTMVVLRVRGKSGKTRKVPLVRVSRETFRSREPMDVTAKAVPISEFKGAGCPKVLDGCNFLDSEDGSCIFTCRTSK